MQRRRLVLDQAVDVWAEDGRVIKPTRPDRLSLDALIGGITPDNLYVSVNLEAELAKKFGGGSWRLVSIIARLAQAIHLRSETGKRLDCHAGYAGSQ